jgi:Family of unknown function (DUF5681)
MGSNAATRFKPGMSGNPGGRPPAAHEVSLHARRYAVEMVNVLVRLARTAEAEAVRKSAAAEVLDRAIGKAPQAIDHTVTKDISRMNLEELRALEERLTMTALAPPDDSNQPTDLFADIEDDTLGPRVMLDPDPIEVNQ